MEKFEQIPKSKAEEEELEFEELEEISEKEAKKLEGDEIGFENLVKKKETEIKKVVLGIQKNSEQRIEKVADSIGVSEKIIEDEKEKMVFKEREKNILDKIKGLTADIREKIDSLFSKEKQEEIETIEQKEGIAEIRAELRSIVEENPNLYSKELIKIVNTRVKELNLNKYQKENLKKWTQLYGEKHKAIIDAREKYPEDKELFKSTTGIEPKGKIEVIQGHVSFYFKCSNPEDFVNAYNAAQEFENKEVSPQMKKMVANKVSGMRFSHFSKIDNLKGLLILENSRQTPSEKSEAKRRHEEQHVFFKLYKDSAPKKKPSKEYEKMKAAKTVKEKEKNLLPYLREGRKNILEWKSKNELLAYYKEGEDMINVFLQLVREKKKSGAYDFFEKQKKDIQNELKEFGIKDELSKTAMQKVFKEEYKNIIRQARYAIGDLEKMGKSRDEIIEFLIAEPLEKWTENVKKLVDKNKEKR